jgi:agmatinase
VRKILEAGALPVVLGGDHSVNIPCINAFAEDCAKNGPIHIVQIDAHLDFVDERHGVRYGHGNPMRRAAEKSLCQRPLADSASATSPPRPRRAMRMRAPMGSDILSVRQIRALGTQAVLERIPAGARYYVTIDIDGFDPSIAPGTGTPSHGGFIYYEVLEILSALARRGDIVGIDLVEVAPDYDHTGGTAILAAQVLMNLIGRIMHARKG